MNKALNFILINVTIVALVACGGRKKDKSSESNFVDEWEFETENYQVRIDIVSEGVYRYKSWSKSKKRTDEPDLILENGYKECWCDPCNRIMRL